MNGQANCILEVCCPPNAAGIATDTAIEALATEMVKDGLEKEYAKHCAKWMLRHFDLAPRGSLHQLKAEVARLARENP